VGEGTAADGGGAIVDLDLMALGDDAAGVLRALLEGVSALPPDGVLKATLVCDPAALRPALEARGLETRSEATDRGAARLEVRSAGAWPEILDLRDLEAPEPLNRILEAAAELAAGEALLARTPCYPRPLLVLLARRGLAFEAIEEPDGTGLVHVRKPA
jgi:hypothetical protein